MNTMDRIYQFCRWALGIIFIYAGGTKLPEPEIFTVLIEAYGIVPDALLMPVAIGLPLLEVIAGIGILFELRGSLALITGLLVLFIAILGYGIRMGLDVDCGCFGPGDPEAEAFHGLRLSLFRDFFMMALVIFLYGRRRYRAIRPASAMMIVNKLLRKRRKRNAHV